MQNLQVGALHSFINDRRGGEILSDSVGLASAVVVRGTEDPQIEALGNTVHGLAVLGQQILHLLHISMEALKLSGGVLLFLVAMELLMGSDSEEPDTGDERVNVALVPLGTPLLAGPGAIAAVMVSVAQANNSIASWIGLVCAVAVAHFVMWATMHFSLILSRLLGPGGIMLLTKIMGLLLAAIATELVMGGIFDFIAAT